MHRWTATTNQAAASAVAVSVSSSAAASDTATDGAPLAAEVVAEVALEHVYVRGGERGRARTSSTQKGKAWSMKCHQKLGCYKCTTPTTLEAAERFGHTPCSICCATSPVPLVPMGDRSILID